MVSLGRITLNIDVPETVNSLKVDKSVVTVKGKMGELTKDFTHTKVEIKKLSDREIQLVSYFPRKKDKALIYTVRAHLNNLFNGVSFGFTYRLKIVFSHFPIRVKPGKEYVTIENLYGGRKPKKAKIVGNVKVVVDGEDVVVTGIDREHVGQTCANIQEITRQRGKRRQSPKTFMDGVFVYERLVNKAED